jgi:hypothetical protein
VHRGKGYPEGKSRNILKARHTGRIEGTKSMLVLLAYDNSVMTSAPGLKSQSKVWRLSAKPRRISGDSVNFDKADLLIRPVYHVKILGRIEVGCSMHPRTLDVGTSYRPISTKRAGVL